MYVILLVASHLVTTVPENETETNSTVTEGSLKSKLVYIADPESTNRQKITQLEESLEIAVFYVNENSFSSNATAIKDLISELNWKEYHVFGEGIGGSVAMHLAVLDSNKATSLSLLDSNGIEELELLGGYHLNHAIYQVNILWNSFIFYAIPHFGILESVFYKIIRSKSQFNSDQRLIRELLTEISIPVSIIHTPNAKINEAVSIEHNRLLPQSELNVIDTDEWLPIVASFISNVEIGKAIDRYEVTPSAQAESIKPFDPVNGVKADGTALILLMLVIILSTLISEDLTSIGTGLLIARGLIGFIPGVLACFIGIFVGDILLYLAGRWLASSTLHKAPLKWFITEKDIQLSYQWFQAKGPAIIIASRFIPGSRLPTYFSAGAIGASFGMFILYFGIASIIWTPILVGLAVLLGQEMINYFSIYQDYALWVIAAVIGILFVLFKVIIPSFTYKGRRLLVGWFKRRRHWEFWSPLIIYTPVLVYSVFLWIKHRSISIVTLANPGFKDGGFIKESKSDILDLIGDKNSVAHYALIKGALTQKEKKLAVEKYMADYSLDFPIVIKPDVGERGNGVTIPKNLRQLDIALRESESDLIVQEYIDGVEFGIFYFRFPTQERGQIFSITKKKYMWLVGDGKHNLEELILRDPRAVCLAEKHFEQHIDDLFNIPPKGKKIKLVEVGTHARGSIFLDAIAIKTEYLENRIDAISKSIPGFYFGRFDIKVPSDQHLKDGNELKILELNGVTSEATHIYDPKYNFFYGVKVLITQWKLAYAIADQVRNQNSKLKPPGIIYILNLLR